MKNTKDFVKSLLLINNKDLNSTTELLSGLLNVFKSDNIVFNTLIYHRYLILKTLTIVYVLFYLIIVFPNNKLYKCIHEGCNKQFSWKSNMLVHCKTHNDRQRSFRCDYQGCSSVSLLFDLGVL